MKSMGMAPLFPPLRKQGSSFNSVCKLTPDPGERPPLGGKRPSPSAWLGGPRSRVSKTGAAHPRPQALGPTHKPAQLPGSGQNPSLCCPSSGPVRGPAGWPLSPATHRRQAPWGNGFLRRKEVGGWDWGACTGSPSSALGRCTLFLTFLDHGLVEKAHSRLIHDLQIGEAVVRVLVDLVFCHFLSSCSPRSWSCLLCPPLPTHARGGNPPAGPGPPCGRSPGHLALPREEGMLNLGQATLPRLFAPGPGCQRGRGCPTRPSAELGERPDPCPFTTTGGCGWVGARPP